MAQPEPMRRWVRWLVVRVLAFAIRRRPAAITDLRLVLARAFPRRPEEEMDDLWWEARERAVEGR